jgi:adenylate cyclase class 2
VRAVPIRGCQHPVMEREVKLPFDSVEQARETIGRLGARLLRPRRLQDDVLYDTDVNQLLAGGSVLRVRRDGPTTVLTWKGPVQPSAMKLREELETTVGDGTVLEHVLVELGFTPRFRYQKYREEYALDHLIVAIDDTPIGVYVELEGTEEAILAATSGLGRTPADYVVASYRTLFQARQRADGTDAQHMVFSAT